MAVSTTFVSKDVWPRLTNAVKNARGPCEAAVAYFGIGGSKLLPLSRGSRLVVDASEYAVKAGQTHPGDLLTLANRGVLIYSIPNLHAKVFLVSREAYIGSANVSANSSARLVEAVVRSTDSRVVNAAKQFIREHCLRELSPSMLKALLKIYRPPRVPGARRGKPANKRGTIAPVLPRLFVARLELVDWSDNDEKIHEKGLAEAQQRQQHGRDYRIESFRLTSRPPYRRYDVIVQVTDEGSGNILVSPPGNVLHVIRRSKGARSVWFVYLECAVRRRRPLSSVARAIGYGAKRKLGRDSMVRNPVFAQALLRQWAKEA